MSKPNTAAERLVSTVNATGGALRFTDGTVAPAGDPDWIDLGDAYLAACAELVQEPKLTDSKGD